MTKLVARLLAKAALWFESRHLSKILNGRHKQRSDQHTVARQNIYKKLRVRILKEDKELQQTVRKVVFLPENCSTELGGTPLVCPLILLDRRPSYFIINGTRGIAAILLYIWYYHILMLLTIAAVVYIQGYMLHPTATLVLHRTRIDKCAIKNSLSMAKGERNFECHPSVFTCKSRCEGSARL